MSGFHGPKQLTSRNAYHDFILPPFQLQFAAVYLGVAQGAAAGYTRTKAWAWPYGGDNKEKATEGWYILEGYSKLQAKIWAAEALIDRTAEQVFKHIHAPRGDLTYAARGEIAVQVAASKAQIIETTLETTSKIFELIGARASLSIHGFDRFWRNTIFTILWLTNSGKLAPGAYLVRSPSQVGILE